MELAYDIPRVRVVAKSSKESLGFRGILNPPLCPVKHVEFKGGVDSHVAGRLGRLNTQGLLIELIFGLARSLGGNLPRACPGRSLGTLAPAQPKRVFAPAVLAGVPYFTLRTFSRVPGINGDNHGQNPSGF